VGCSAGSFADRDDRLDSAAVVRVSAPVGRSLLRIDVRDVVLGDVLLVVDAPTEPGVFVRLRVDRAVKDGRAAADAAGRLCFTVRSTREDRVPAAASDCDPCSDDAEVVRDVDRSTVEVDRDRGCTASVRPEVLDDEGRTRCDVLLEAGERPRLSVFTRSRAVGESARSTVAPACRSTTRLWPSGRIVRTSRPSMVALRSTIPASGICRPILRSTSVRLGAVVVATTDARETPRVATPWLTTWREMFSDPTADHGTQVA
jgi:hypothetical protein